MPDTSLLILGAGSFAIETLEIAELAGDYTPAGFVVSQTPASSYHAGLPVFEEADIPDSLRNALVVGGIVSTRRQGFIERLARRGYSFATLRHPSAVISRRATVAEGAVIGAGVIVASNTQVGPHVLLNRGANIGHDNQLGPFVTISPGATLAGAIDVGAGAYIGVGAVIRDHVTIGEGAVVAAGAVVVKPVEPHVLVAGCPATVMRRDVDGL